jgi:hypothetical protein
MIDENAFAARTLERLIRRWRERASGIAKEAGLRTRFRSRRERLGAKRTRAQRRREKAEERAIAYARPASGAASLGFLCPGGAVPLAGVRGRRHPVAVPGPLLVLAPSTHVDDVQKSHGGMTHER